MWKASIFSVQPESLPTGHSELSFAPFTAMPSQQTQFRPCIDLHEGRVKQIVGSTLGSTQQELQTNFVSENPSTWYAELFARDQLTGGHIIKLGQGNDRAAREALAAYPGGLQIGGGITADNAADWLENGASHVITTSFLFDDAGKFLEKNLHYLVSEIGKEKVVIDLSCQYTGEGWTVVMNRWQTLTDLRLTLELLDQLADYCAEFLIHATDVEGKCEGIDSQLVSLLGRWKKAPVTYAGGAQRASDLELVQELSGGAVDLTIGSALDIFGGRTATYRDCVSFNHQRLRDRGKAME